jgi:hypothetical protein
MTPLEVKAMRLVLDNKVVVGWVNPDGTAASGTVDGHHGTYQCSYSPAGRICTCPAGANHRKCSHAVALELAVAYDRDPVSI